MKQQMFNRSEKKPEKQTKMEKAYNAMKKIHEREARVAAKKKGAAA